MEVLLLLNNQTPSTDAQFQNIFRDYLTHSNVFETHLSPSSLGLSQESRELSDLVSDLIDSLHSLNELCQSKFDMMIASNIE